MMMMGSGSGSGSNQNYPANVNNVFTAAQWEELEQQALIYKYMVSGVPVPTDLILSVRRSLYNNNHNSSFSSLSTHPTTFGVWEGGFPYNQLYQIGGVGSRKIDLEPGRCRRTDGKKWRCSKEAYPDSKYCERHMHRGRNRSRKPVEFSSSSSSSSSSTAATTLINVSSSPSATISKSDAYPSFSSVHTTFLDSTTPSFSPHPTLKDYRQLQGMKDIGEDERSAYFQLNDPYSTTTTQKMSSSGQHHNNYSQFSFQNLKDEQKKEEGQHCFVMGTDFIKPSEEATKKVDEKQPFHHFFSPPKPALHDPNWVEVDHHQQLPKAPLSTQDLFQSKPRPYW